MTKSELTTMLHAVQTHREQYRSRLNSLLRLYHEIEADTTFRDLDPHSQEELVTEAFTVHFDYTKHLHHYSPLIKYIKASLDEKEPQSATYHALLTEHYEAILDFNTAHMDELEEYIDLVHEAYELHRELLS